MASWVDANANIVLDVAENATIPISWIDDAGAPVSLTGRTLRLVVRGRPELTLPIAFVNGIPTLSFTPAWSAAFGAKPRSFRVEVTNADQTKQDLWSATISTTGFVS